MSIDVYVGSPTIPADGLAFATGAQLNSAQSTSSYDTRSFYVSYTGANQNAASDWELTYSHAQNSGKSYEGALVTARWANATWAQNDEGVVENDGDVTEAEADRNTEHFIDQLAAYRESGVLAVSVGFECGNPINNEADAAIDDGAGIIYHISGGSPSAFESGGAALKAAHLARMESLIEAAAAEGMAVCLQFFYARQCRWMSTTANYEAATDTAVAWLKSKGYRNVLIDMANEAGDDPSGNWAVGHGEIWQDDAGAAQMVAYFKDSWGADPNQPAVGCSSRTVPGALTNAETDIVWVHLNVIAAGNVDTELDALQSLDQPVAVNETDRHSTTRQDWYDAEVADWDDVRLEDASPGAMLSTAWQRMDVSRVHGDAVRQPFMPEPGVSTDLAAADAQERLRNLTRAWLDFVETSTGGLPGRS
jgi:hypothetical protein